MIWNPRSPLGCILLALLFIRSLSALCCRHQRWSVWRWVSRWASFLGLITQPGWEAWKRVTKRSQEKHSFPLQLSSRVHAFSTACTFTSQREEHENMAAEVIWREDMADAVSKVFCRVEDILGVFCQRLRAAVCMCMKQKLLGETSSDEQMMNELAMNVLPFETAGSKALHVRFSPPDK